MHLKNATIPMSYAAWIARTLRLNETNYDPLLRGTELASQALLDETALMSSGQLIRVLENALEMTVEPAFGLALGQLLTPPTHGSLGYLALSSPDLRTAMRAFADFAHLRLGVFNMVVEEGGQCLSLTVEINMEVSDDIYRCLTEGAMVSIQSVAEHIAGRAITEATAEFGFADPNIDYRQYLHAKVCFDAPVTRLIIPNDLADVTNITANHAAYSLAIEQCQLQLEALDLQPRTLTTRVKRVLLNCPPRQLSERNIADTLFMTKRTLARRLAKENTSFRTLRDTHMASLARSYLTETSLSVEVIAGLLDYHDSSSFRRAFRKWTGMTPQQARQTSRDIKTRL